MDICHIYWKLVDDSPHPISTTFEKSALKISKSYEATCELMSNHLHYVIQIKWAKKQNSGFWKHGKTTILITRFRCVEGVLVEKINSETCLFFLESKCNSLVCKMRVTLMAKWACRAYRAKLAHFLIMNLFHFCALIWEQ